MNLTLLVFTLFSANLAALVLKRKRTIQNIVIVSLSFLALVQGFIIFREFVSSNEKFVFLNLGDFGFSLEPIGMIFILMVLFLWLCNNVYSISYFANNTDLNQTRIHCFIAISVLLSVLIGLSKDLLSTFILYELLTIFTYPLVANNLTSSEKDAAKFYLFFLMISSMVLFLPAVLFLYSKYGSLEYNKISNLEDSHVLIVVFCLIYGVSKAAIVPMHFWLPKAMVAPIPVSALLHAVAVVKSGVFILIKVFVYIIGLKSLQSLPQVYGVNILTIMISLSLLVSSIMAVYQKSLKKLLAYSTINQLSVCILSLSLFNKTGVIAAVLHMLSHAAAKITLFFGAGHIYTNSRLSEIDLMSGISKRMPITCLLFMVSALSIIGIPVLAGFISKAYIMVAAFQGVTKYYAVSILAISILFTANYFIRLVHRFYIVPSQHDISRVKREDITNTMLWGMVLSSSFVIFFFLIFQDILNLLNRVFL
ncbi:MAG: proton-conducting transporter membrane subunit [Rickettsiales bacterium]